MTYLGKILAVVLISSLSSMAMAGSGEGKIHDHQQMKDHIKRDKDLAASRSDECVQVSAEVADSANSQGKRTGETISVCGAAKKRKVHDHRKSKHL